MVEEINETIEQSIDLNKSSTDGKSVRTFYRILTQLIVGPIFGIIATYVGFFIFRVRMCSSGPTLIINIFFPLGAIAGVIIGSFCFDVFSKRKHKLGLIAIISAVLSGEVVAMAVYFLLPLCLGNIHVAVFFLIWFPSITFAAAISYNYVQLRTKSK